MGSREKHFLFSVVIPVYNTEQFLRETIESVLGQTIQFRKNIELVLINNATEDNAGSICEYYRMKYPENIKYIILDENKGVCNARNIGKNVSEGKYINFLDSDDKWEKHAFEKVYKFFEKNYDKVDVVACRIRHFDKNNNWHVLDHKFKESRIVSIFEEDSAIQLNLGSVFIKQNVAALYMFDERLDHAEDAKYINQIIIEKEKYAILREAVFYYRTRTSMDSVLQNVEQSISWYVETPNLVYQYFFGISKKKYGYILRYIQYLVMYEIHWRCGTRIIPEKVNQLKYREIMDTLIREIEDDIIISQNISVFKKVYILSRKYKLDILQKCKYFNNGLYFNDLQLERYSDKKSLLIEKLEIVHDQLILRGIVNCVFLADDIKLALSVNGKDTIIKLYEGDESLHEYCFGKEIHRRKYFCIELDLVHQQKIHFKYQINSNYKIINFKLGKYSKLTESLDNAYYYKNGYVVRVDNKGGFDINILPRINVNVLEVKVLHELACMHEWKACLCRIIGKLFNPDRIHRKIWLITDRIMSADDCGEYFFKYLSTVALKNIKPYFVISSKSSDYDRLKRYGKVVRYRSIQHKILFLLASKIISSLTNEWVTNTLYDVEPFIKDILRYDFVHIQHGVIKDDLSAEINWHKKNIGLLVTSSEIERQSILDLPYGYDKSVVKNIGLPRFDAAVSAKNIGNTLLVAPTWRKYLVGVRDNETDSFKYNPLFKESEYYMFYEKLINDLDIITTLKEYGMRGILRLHPMVQIQKDDFHENDVFKIESRDKEYKNELEDTAILVTDYSSIAFDYAYFHKPVIYAQFDRAKFYEGHTYRKGYFDYEKQGFGPVCYDYNGMIELIKRAISSGCRIDTEYVSRVRNFFAYNDCNNCKRLFKELRDDL